MTEQGKLLSPERLAWYRRELQITQTEWAEDFIIELLDHIAALEAQERKWVEIKSKAYPPNFRPVWAWNGEDVLVATYDAGRGSWSDDEDYEIRGVTHWHDIIEPEPPAEQS